MARQTLAQEITQYLTEQGAVRNDSKYKWV